VLEKARTVVKDFQPDYIINRIECQQLVGCIPSSYITCFRVSNLVLDLFNLLEIEIQTEVEGLIRIDKVD
jgi:hypothetical protein